MWRTDVRTCPLDIADARAWLPFVSAQFVCSGVAEVLTVKGKDRAQDRTKGRFLAEWTQAVTAHGGFGRWVCDVSYSPADVADILARHAEAETG